MKKVLLFLVALTLLSGCAGMRFEGEGLRLNPVVQEVQV